MSIKLIKWMILEVFKIFVKTFNIIMEDREKVVRLS